MAPLRNPFALKLATTAMGLDSSTLANIAIAASAVVALIFGILQVLAAVRDRRERLTIEVIRGFQSREFSQQVLDLRANPPPETAKAWLALPEATRVTQMHFLQEMEMLGLLVYDGTIDLNLVERTLGSYVTGMWKRFEPGVLELRTSLPDPYMAEYFQYLAIRIERLMSETPRRPAYEAIR